MSEVSNLKTIKRQLRCLDLVESTVSEILETFHRENRKCDCRSRWASREQRNNLSCRKWSGSSKRVPVFMKEWPFRPAAILENYLGEFIFWFDFDVRMGGLEGDSEIFP